MLVLTSIAFFILGAILASFAGVVAERIYTGQSWVRGRSRCDSCGRFLTARDLIPILSLVWYRGRCRACHARISWVHAVGEVVLGALFVLSYHTLGLTPALLVFLLVLIVLFVLTLYDLRHTIVPPAFSTVLIVLAAVFRGLEAVSRASFGSDLLVAGCIALGFFLLHVASRGRAMGLGDTPVSFALSLLVGARALSGLVFSFWIGAVIGIGILVTRPKGHRMGIEVPFVPFMVAGYLLAFFTTWNPFAPW